MALTKDAPARERAAPAEGRTSGILWSPWTLLALAAVLVVALGWGFLTDPTITAPTRDPAWYTWRANVIANGQPVQVVQDWGPFSAFSGGYRVAVPMFGAILHGVAGVQFFQLSAFLMIGMPVLAGLAMGVFGYRSRRDPLLILLTLLAAAALFLTTPYVGYLDNITILYVLALLLAFVPAAQESWGARAACFLLGVLGAFTHPTTCVLFGLSLLGVFAWRVVTARFHVADALRRHGPALLSVGFGMIFGLALWAVGIWGQSAPFADAALPPPYDRAFFNTRLLDWILSMKPLVTFTLAGLAIVATVWQARRLRRPADTYSVTSIWYLFPYIGVAGALTAAALPYYRFMNATSAIMILAGLGAWIAIRWLTREGSARRAVGIVVALGIVAAMVWVFAVGWQEWIKPNNQWIDQDTRVAMASVSEVVQREPDTPIVFLENYGNDQVAYGWAKTFTNVARTAIPGDSVIRSAAYFGTLDNFLAGQPTEFSNDPVPKVDKYHGIGLSEGYLDEMNSVLDRYDTPPLVFVVREFNKGESTQLFPQGCMTDEGSPDDRIVAVGCDVGLVSTPETTTPDQTVLQAGMDAATAQQAAFETHPGPLGDPLHELRVLAGLVLLLVVPGLLAARFFDVDDVFSKIALIPGLSFALVVLTGILVATVWRGPFDGAHAWATAFVATGTGAGLGLWKQRLLRPLQKFGSFFNSMFSVFSNASFAALMGTQFLAQMADGVVQGSLAKSIAFGGEQGFDVTSAPSARYLLVVVLALYVPYTFVSPFAGAFIDRFDRRTLLSASNLFRAGVVALVGVALLVVGDSLPDAFLIITILVALACTRILLAIKSAGLPAVLHGRDLMQGNGLSQAGGALFQVFGGGLALIGTTVAPAGVVALAGGGLYVAAALVARHVHRLEANRRTSSFAEEAKRVVRDIVAGVREVAHTPAAALGVVSFQALRMEFFGFVALVFALEARMLLTGKNGDQTVVAIAGAFGALGAALGMVLAQRLKDRIPPVRLLIASLIAVGLGVLLFGGVPTLVGFSGILFIGGLGFFLGKISADTIVQQAMPDDFRGRAFSLFDIAYNLGWIVPAAILALVWQEGRVRLILIASGIVFLAATAAIALWSRRIGGAFHRDDDVAEEPVSG
jgi:MFS transporter